MLWPWLSKTSPWYKQGSNSSDHSPWDFTVSPKSVNQWRLASLNPFRALPNKRKEMLPFNWLTDCGRRRTTMLEEGKGLCIKAWLTSRERILQSWVDPITIVKNKASQLGVGEEYPRALAELPLLISLATIRVRTLVGDFLAQTQREGITRAWGWFFLSVWTSASPISLPAFVFSRLAISSCIPWNPSWGSSDSKLLSSITWSGAQTKTRAPPNAIFLFSCHVSLTHQTGSMTQFHQPKAQKQAAHLLHAQTQLKSLSQSMSCPNCWSSIQIPILLSTLQWIFPSLQHPFLMVVWICLDTQSI